MPVWFFRNQIKYKTMKIIISILIFYKKLIVSSFITALCMGFLGLILFNEYSFKFVGISYIFISLLFHYFVYEVRNYNEYYFYFNLGLSRSLLWGITLLFSIAIGLIFIII
jgi:hypothetical protein